MNCDIAGQWLLLLPVFGIPLCRVLPCSVSWPAVYMLAASDERCLRSRCELCLPVGSDPVLAPLCPALLGLLVLTQPLSGPAEGHGEVADVLPQSFSVRKDW